MDPASRHTLQIVIVGVHEMHPEHVEGLVRVPCVRLAPGVPLVAESVQRLEEPQERQPLRGAAGMEMPVERLERSGLRQHLDARRVRLRRQRLEIREEGIEVQEPRDRDRPSVLIDEQQGHQAAMGVAGVVDQRGAREGPGVPDEGHGGAEREPVRVQPRESRLLTKLARQVREREAQAQSVPFRHAAGEGHRLEGDAGEHIEVLERQSKQVADLVVVHLLDNGGNEDDSKAGLPGRLQHGKLPVQERRAAEREEHLVGRPVHLEVHVLQARVPGPAREIRIGQLQPVAGHLEMGEPQRLRSGDDLEKARVQRRFPSGELHRKGRRRALGPEPAQGVHGLLKGQFVGPPVGVGKADLAGQIAPGRQVHVGQRGVAGVPAADAAPLRTLPFRVPLGIRESPTIPEMPRLHAEEHLGVREHDVR